MSKRVGERASTCSLVKRCSICTLGTEQWVHTLIFCNVAVAVETVSSTFCEARQMPAKKENKVNSEKTERGLYQALVWIAGFLVVLWTPAGAYFLYSATHESYFNADFYTVVLCLEYSSCAINPLIYHRSLPDIQRAMDKMIGWRETKRVGPISGMSTGINSTHNRGTAQTAI